MANEATNEKKESNLTRGIILLVLGVIALAVGKDYVWVLFGTIEIPLQIVGGIFAAIGAVLTVIGIKDKKKEKQNTEE